MIGQTSFNTNGNNTGGASAKTLQFYNGTSLFVAFMAFDPQGNLWVADSGNNRVLRYPASSIGSGASNGPAADIVLGQTDFVTTTYNNPGNDPTNLNALNEPTARRVAEQAGWQQVRTTYFNSVLLPVAILLRVLDRVNTKTTESSLDLWVPPEPLNWLLERPLSLEAALIARGGRIPSGLSLLAVYR